MSSTGTRDWYSKAVEICNNLTGGRVGIGLASAHLQGMQRAISKVTDEAERALFVDIACASAGDYHGKGLRALCAHADRYSLILVLDAALSADLDDEELTEGFSALGFAQFHNQYMLNGMIRHPKKLMG